MLGVVSKSTGSWYSVKGEDGKLYNCRTRGKLRLKNFTATNPIAVGDHVDFDIEPGTENGLITGIRERRNYIIRKSNKLSKQTQVIAANIDQAMLLVTLVAPETSAGFIDRFLVTAEAYHIPVILIFNKADIYEGDMNYPLKEIVELYTSIGYSCLTVSAKTGLNVDRLTDVLKNKTTLFSGHSGVGKSTLLNTIAPEINQKTGEISNHLRGMHTTTFAEMFELPFGGNIIDTPGIKDFGIVFFKPTEIAQYFPEMRALMHDCRFNNCLHVNEPDCAVLKAVEQGRIPDFRYYSYLSILRNEDVHH